MGARPILVSGSHRSGTTWIGRMLAASGRVGYLHEPFANEHPGWAAGLMPTQFQYICAENADAFRPIVDRFLAFRYPWREQLGGLRRIRQLGRLGLDSLHGIAHRVRGRRPLLKDPFAVFSAAWLAETYGTDVVLVVRHPAAFAECLLRHRWAFDFRHLSEQPLLLRDLLCAYRDDVMAAAARPPDVLHQAVLLWNVIYSAVRQFRDRHPDWHIVKYESLATDPVAGFRAIYAALGLPWTPRAAARVTEYSSPRNAARPGPYRRDSAGTSRQWQARLAPDEIRRIYDGVRDVAQVFYGEGEWPRLASGSAQVVAA